MTLGLAMKYDKGILLMADTELSGNGIRLTDANKIYTSGNNIAFSIAGRLGEGQQAVLKINETEDYIHNMLKHFTPKKLKRKSKKAIDLESKLTLLQGMEFITKKTDGEVELFPKDDKRGYMLNTLEFYIDHRKLNFCLKSYGEFMRSLMKEDKMEELDLLIVGFDKNGASILYVNGAGFSLTAEDYYYAIGAADLTAMAMLDSLYKKELTEKEALFLGTYIGVKCSQRTHGINDRFKAVSIKKNNDIIERRLVPDEEINQLKEIVGHVKPDFPFMLAK